MCAPKELNTSYSGDARREYGINYSSLSKGNYIGVPDAESALGS
jgi:hypothetical protein